MKKSKKKGPVESTFEEMQDLFESMNQIDIRQFIENGRYDEVDPGSFSVSDSELTRSSYPVVILEEAVAVPDIHQQLPITVDDNRPVIDSAIKTGKPVIALFRRNNNAENPADAYSDVGIVGCVIRYEQATSTDMCIVLFQGGPRVKVKKLTNAGEADRLSATVRPYPIDFNMSEEEALPYLEEIQQSYDRLLQLTGHSDMPTMESVLKQYPLLGAFLYALYSAPLETSVRDGIMKLPSITEMLRTFLSELVKAEKYQRFRNEIREKVEQDLADTQRDNFMREEMAYMREELGEGEESDVKDFEKRASEKKWSEETEKHFRRELNRLQRFPPNTPDYSIQYNYLDNFLNLPWGACSVPDFDFDRVVRTLDRDHFGLEKVKERILEQIAVAKLRSDNKAPIICLVGPPGVGKTSLGRSIAEAMEREYSRVSFGGMHDEAEIRGHRRTYLGAMPGRIIAALMKGKTSNPVMMLDEIDKIGKDYKGDPSMALLEVLDPEQNSHFHDNYLDADYDLSNIFFIATANTLETVMAPLLDRMEVISIPGYITEEKVEIAARHLLPKQLKALGFGEEKITFEPEALTCLVDFYTRESGVRRLEKMIAKVLRRLAVKKVKGEDYPKNITVQLVRDILGKTEYNPDRYDNNDFTGVVTGLAWTSVGGEILYIESSVTDGKGKLTLTGNLGDVMKESATLALQYLRANSVLLGLESAEVFDKKDFHIHVPEGAIPKDGPSAGVTMTTSLASALTGRKVRRNIAMTGEITLRGKVLPVGGIKEKIIAAKRAGITEIILCRDNEKDILEIAPRYIEGLNFTYVDTISEVLGRALL